MLIHYIYLCTLVALVVARTSTLVFDGDSKRCYSKEKFPFPVLPIHTFCVEAKEVDDAEWVIRFAYSLESNQTVHKESPLIAMKRVDYEEGDRFECLVPHIARIDAEDVIPIVEWIREMGEDFGKTEGVLLSSISLYVRSPKQHITLEFGSGEDATSLVLSPLGSPPLLPSYRPKENGWGSVLKKRKREESDVGEPPSAKSFRTPDDPVKLIPGNYESIDTAVKIEAEIIRSLAGILKANLKFTITKWERAKKGGKRLRRQTEETNTGFVPLAESWRAFRLNTASLNEDDRKAAEDSSNRSATFLRGLDLDTITVQPFSDDKILLRYGELENGRARHAVQLFRYGIHHHPPTRCCHPPIRVLKRPLWGICQGNSSEYCFGVTLTMFIPCAMVVLVVARASMPVFDGDSKRCYSKEKFPFPVLPIRTFCVETKEVDDDKWMARFTYSLETNATLYKESPIIPMKTVQQDDDLKLIAVDTSRLPVKDIVDAVKWSYQLSKDFGKAKAVTLTSMSLYITPLQKDVTLKFGHADDLTSLVLGPPGSRPSVPYYDFARNGWGSLVTRKRKRFVLEESPSAKSFRKPDDLADLSLGEFIYTNSSGMTPNVRVEIIRSLEETLKANIGFSLLEDGKPEEINTGFIGLTESWRAFRLDTSSLSVEDRREAEDSIKRLKTSLPGIDLDTISIEPIGDENIILRYGKHLKGGKAPYAAELLCHSTVV
ncbi:hypothetical protein FOZ63_017531 [Perkinsus olseni]|uniref:Uncharacterized protein n=1 Tax=Perkinsus olseni TaxID=32597 RepID=A0A7J6PZ48_PEROL|nr:hypothetical protein FOZ63_017531 [Perkinsus olseni]KAF4740621.1 hypothetical protein FOZ62_017422 [Perkinsus olseni]